MSTAGGTATRYLAWHGGIHEVPLRRRSGGIGERSGVVAAVAEPPAAAGQLQASRLAPAFIDRIVERQALSHLLAQLRAGRSRVLVLRGEAGCGKTALLAQLSAVATGCRVMWTTGVESEMELAFAGLQSLCAPLLDLADRLPDPQREALSTAFGMSSGPQPERFLVGLAVLGLLAEAADEQPLVFIIDDAQWLDHASSETLAFVARRLLAEQVAMVFAVREHGDDAAVLAGLPEMLIGGLDAENARVLLDAVIPGPIDEAVKSRILEEARGNPLALIELPRGMRPAELAGGFALPDSRPLTGRIEREFVQRAGKLSRNSQLLVLAAAAEPTGDARLLWRAAERLSLGMEARGEAESAGLITLGVRVRFPHPLVRSAIYHASSPNDRRDVHRALAEVTDPVHDPDRRAWHRAHATARPDEGVAAELVLSADRAYARGGLAAAAAFLQQASELTPDATVRVERALAAAQAKLDAADTESAARLLAGAGLGPLDEVQRARLERLRARTLFLTQHGDSAQADLLEAARRLEPLDDAMARNAYLEAVSAAMVAGRFAAAPNRRQLAELARPLVPRTPGTVADLLLEGLINRFTEGYASSVAPLTRALRHLAQVDEVGEDQRWLALASWLARELWDDDLWHALSARGARIGRESGRLSLLAHSLDSLASFQVLSGAFSNAALLIDEACMITQSTGLPPTKHALCDLSGARGDQLQMQALSASAMENAAARGDGWTFDLYWHHCAVMHNGFGEYERALSAAQQACQDENGISYGWALTELVEAAVRCGKREEAALALDRLTERTRASGTEWALGIQARCQALFNDEECFYQKSAERLERSHAALDLARSRLVYGEWLRRENRRADARELLRAAHESFCRMGAEAFAERARRELLATGETISKREGEGLEALTPQELHVARMAREGHTNPEIGARLFISPRTVEYHLHKVFRKLGISGRRSLRDALVEGTGPAASFS